MTAGSLTAHALTQAYLDRIAAIDKRGPALNSVIELNPDALAIAAALDAERKAKGPRGPLHGVPVLIKDNIDTADRMMTTAGSLALLGSIAARDSVVAAAAARGRRGTIGQNQSQRMGQLPVQPLYQRLERTRRPDAQPLRARPQRLRFQFRIGRGRFRQPVRAGHRHRNRRLHRVPIIHQWRGRHQADAGLDSRHRHHSHRAFAGYRRAHGAHRRRCRHFSGRAHRRWTIPHRSTRTDCAARASAWPATNSSASAKRATG